ncbi:MAG: DsbA family protein [Candidatus Moranbacteria bacterium]|nr:DsbA family protein [Candidatus Moranbacteria bacterium]MBP9801054.1 DsbA family protein [Candidatus Moranbacteria bacterium]
MEEEKWEDVDDTVKSKATNKDAVTIAGAVLLGCLIISGTLAYVSARGVKIMGQVGGTEVAANQAGSQQPDAVKVSIDEIKALFTDKNIMFGKKDSKILFVEFSDPSCPFCQVASGKNPELNKQAGAQFTMEKDGGTYLPPVPEMKKLVDSGKAAYVWLYANGHGNGELGTKALYCAKEKGKFWEAHDLLMSAAGYDLMNNTVKNDVAKSGDMANFLKNAVKVDDMKKCLESGKYDDRIAGDMAIAQKIGFRGTPSFFVNTTNFAGAYSYKDMMSVVEEALKK